MIQDVHDILYIVQRRKNGLFRGQSIPLDVWHILFIQSVNNNRLQLLSTTCSRRRLMSKSTSYGAFAGMTTLWMRMPQIGVTEMVAPIPRILV